MTSRNYVVFCAELKIDKRFESPADAWKYYSKLQRVSARLGAAVSINLFQWTGPLRNHLETRAFQIKGDPEPLWPKDRLRRHNAYRKAQRHIHGYYVDYDLYCNGGIRAILDATD